MDSLKNTMRINYLIDLYGDLLTNKQLDYLQLYFCEDLSLSEIAEQYDVSRNAVHDNLKRAVNILEDYEEKLHLLDKHIERKELIDRIEKEQSIDHDELVSYLEKIRDL